MDVLVVVGDSALRNHKRLVVVPELSVHGPVQSRGCWWGIRWGLLKKAALVTARRAGYLVVVSFFLFVRIFFVSTFAILVLGETVIVGSALLWVLGLLA